MKLSRDEPVIVTSGDPLVQLRIGFGAPTRAARLHLILSGLTVLVEPEDNNYDVASGYLTAAGIPAAVEAGKGLHFPVKFLSLATTLPEQVELIGDDLIAPLVELVRYPSAQNLPATLAPDPGGDLHLSWFDGSNNHDEPFNPVASAALLNSEIPFVATSETWDALKAYCRLPVLAGRARVNLDGYVEISTTKPQLVEQSPLPALFRIDDTHFGLPLAYAHALDADSSFVWEGHRPYYEMAPDNFPDLPLTEHARQSLRPLVDALATHRAEAVVWDSGLGRRILTLAAVTCLDAFPLLIVTSPSGVWAWQRHLDLFGREYALTHDRSDVHIITYRDLRNRPVLASPSSIIFDGLSKVLTQDPSMLSVLTRLDNVLDAYRVSCDSEFPGSIEGMVAALSVLRPREFRSDLSIHQRYPAYPEERAREHVESYVSRRTREPHVGLHSFKRSSVIALAASEAQELAFKSALDHPRDPHDMLAEMLVVSSAGPSHATSPKVVVAARRARDAIKENRSVAILTRHQRTAQLLKSMLRPKPVELSDGTRPIDLSVSTVVIRFDDELPDLRRFDEVVVVDYPWSTSALESAVGAASDESGPRRVVLLHLDNTVDDRLAMLAARRRERGVLGPVGPPDAEELNYLLSPRV